MDSHIYDEPDSAESELHVFINPIRGTQTSSRSLWDAIEQTKQTIDESMGSDIRHAMGIRAVLALIRAVKPISTTRLVPRQVYPHDVYVYGHPSRTRGFRVVGSVN